MSGPTVRITTYRDMAGEIDFLVHIEGASIRGTLRDDDARRLIRDLTHQLRVATEVVTEHTLPSASEPQE